MDTIRVCTGCGTTLADNAPEGLCPQCLMKAALETKSGGTAGSAPGRFTPPELSEVARYFPQLDVLELMGQGGMGMVYKARQPLLDRLVALKILPPDNQRDPSFSQRFAQEARALARLNHPNIVTVYDFGQAGPYYYFMMEFVDGANLRQLTATRKLESKEALAIVPKVCEALQYAHDEGVVHRDIKPENILIDKRGRVKIADFGIAKLLGAAPTDYRLTGPQTVIGTPHYMAPEQFDRPQQVDHRADIYSLGVVLYELLTGELPVGRFDPPSARVQIDVRLDEVVLRSLQGKPERRYQHVSELKTDLESICGLVDRLPPGLRTAIGFEYRSKRSVFGLPLVHVASGSDLATGKKRIARGIIAIGDIAHGVVAFGGLAIGPIAFGGCAIGGFAVGGISLGLLTFAGLALGLVCAYGGLAIGPIALGGFAFGYIAGGGMVFGAHAAGGNARDPFARAFFADIDLVTVMVLGMALTAFGILVGMIVPILIRRKLERAAAADNRPTFPARSNPGQINQK